MEKLQQLSHKGVLCTAIMSKRHPKWRVAQLMFLRISHYYGLISSISGLKCIYISVSNNFEKNMHYGFQNLVIYIGICLNAL